MTHAVVHLDELDRVPLDEAGLWRPVRRALGVTAVGIAAFTAEATGDPLIEPHDEASPNAGGHEEVYVVISGGATFTVDGEEIAAPPGTLIRVDVGAHRSAVATAADTTVLVVGGKPGAAMPVSPFEFWYAAEPAYLAGDFVKAAEIASEGLADHPRNGGLNFQLARFLARAGDREAAAERLRVAIADDPRRRAWAADDDALRDLEP